ncbi:hypothetical protein DRQ53_01500 [bacterium]|nr:MAG: hypothetical protein DRQ53_01500 [bacterium]
MRQNPVLLASLVLATVTQPTLAQAGQTRRVPADYTTIGAALLASSADDTVRVAAGTYSPSTNGESFPIAMPDGVTLIGNGMQSSILDAEQTARVMNFAGSGSARASGFTITGGEASRGGGIHVTAGTHEIDDMFVWNCGALNRGSGINVEGTAAPDVHHNVIWECYDTDLSHGGDPHGCQWGGTASGSFRQNLVGRTDSNGLFIIESGGPEVRHNIFMENGIDGLRGRGICFDGDDTTVIAYNLFWDNSIASMIMRDAQGTFTNVDAATANAVSASDGIYGNFDDNPLLTDPDMLDFSLQPSSPAIDAGEPGSGTDPDGTPLDLGPFYHPMAIVGNSPAGAARLASLGGASPNPFNPRTTLELRLERAATVRVDIHDARGRRVRQLIAGHRGPGNHDLLFDGLDDTGRQLASGVYFARMSALGEVDVRPMVLLR